jgi:hypothetical protein
LPLFNAGRCAGDYRAAAEEAQMSDWQSDLKMLQRRPPSKNIMQTIINVMSSDTDDRAAAILAAALVETSLIGPVALATRNEARIKKLFWKPFARWNTFEKRIKEAECVRLIGPQTKNNLDIIRLVRNAFAHSLSEIDFTTPEVERACSLKLIRPELLAAPEPTRQARYHYCYACHEVFQAMIAYVGVPWATGTGWPGRPAQPVLP